MATARVTANTVAQELFAVPRHKKGVIDSINVTNPTGGVVIVYIQDVITTNDAIVASTGAAYTGAEQGAVDRYSVYVAATSTSDVPEDQLKNKEFFGVVSARASGILPTCAIVVSYHFE